MALRSRLYNLHRVLRHALLFVSGRAEPHRDAPLMWAMRRALQETRRTMVQSLPFHGLEQFLPEEVPSLVQPLFLVGSIRSGSSLVARCMGDHPDINYVGFELSRQWVRTANLEIAGAGSQRITHCPPLDASDVSDARKTSVHREFARLHAEAGGHQGSHFMNKTPHFWNKLPFLRALFPDMGLVVTSRDVRSTVASTARMWSQSHRRRGVHHFIPTDPRYCFSTLPSGTLRDIDPTRVFPGGRPSVLAEYWLNVYETIDRELTHHPAVGLIRHQELVEGPERVLNETYEKLGLKPFALSPLRVFEKHRNSQWRSLLNQEEQMDLEAFVERHRARIEALVSADTSL